MVTDFDQIFTYLESIRKQNSFTFADRLAGFLKQIKQYSYIFEVRSFVRTTQTRLKENYKSN